MEEGPAVKGFCGCSFFGGWLMISSNESSVNIGTYFFQLPSF